MRLSDPAPTKYDNVTSKASYHVVYDHNVHRRGAVGEMRSDNRHTKWGIP